MARNYSQRTLKLLFARARQCAYPGCNQRLILEHRGQLTVIAEIAHIRSEKPDGPRHDPAYPEERINDEENLLLLCGTHHKPVDDHESIYPVEELLAWKRNQVAAANDQTLSEGQVEQIFLHYDLNRLGRDGFEKMCQALALHVLGPRTEVLPGPGRDYGWDAAFDGRANGFPSQDAPWAGYIVMQAMYSRPEPDPVRAKRTLGHRVRIELENWSRRIEHGARRPDYMIFATNLQLTAADGELEHLKGLINSHAHRLGLRGWLFWDETRLAVLLENFPDVRRAVSSLSASAEVVASLLAHLITASTDKAFRPGEPGHEAAFQPAYDLAGGTYKLGTALGRVQEHQLGWLQHFSGGVRGEPAVLCQLYGKGVVAAATAVWNDIEAIGDGIVGGGAIGAGFPVSGEPSPPGFIGSDADTVELAGGQWGPEKRGRLRRSSTGPALWQPELAFDSAASKDRDAWSSLDDQRDLRARIAGRIPLSATRWRISRRARMLAAVDATGIAAAFHALADRRSLLVAPSSWQEIEEPDGHNNSRFASYQITADTADGRTALALCLRLTLPDGYSTEVNTVVDLRVDFRALAAAVVSSDNLPMAPHLTLNELKSFFVHAWPAATTALLLAAAETPLELPPAGAPRLELHIHNEQLGHSDLRPAIPVLDMVDLSPLGSPRGTGPRELSVGVTTPLDLPAAAIAKAVDDAFVWMVEDAGFVTPELT
ncbi:HNH endonuclease signature motif containing protein [Amycolatopsis sp. NPDC024027]|uniref:HNH endonuclease signature motif containing protein n=1 Tax=Amycolatopsis sp. NPDC024027 TaxID=3154327 RepID=UPI00340ABE2F